MTDISVLVTRPAAQSQHFAEMLTDAGLATDRLPTIEINFTEADLSDLDDHDLIVFTSVNAVTGAHRNKPLPWQTRAKTAAIGSATAKALENLATRVDLKPATGASSEALLEVIDDVHNKKIAIVRGDTGRETLHDTLISRGAEVRYYSVYRRVLPQYTLEDLHKRFSAGLPDIISITSDLGLNHLMQLIPPQLKAELLQRALVVNSERCAESARKYGFTATVLVADPPGDTGQLPKILQIAKKLLTTR